MTKKVIIFVFTFMLLTGSLLSQEPDPPCDMDCLPQSPWLYDHLGPYSIPGCPNCTISFDCWYRPSACGVFKDLQLGEITLSLACLACPFSIKDFIDFAEDQLILNNPIPKPDTGHCETNWRAIRASCWAFLPMGGDTILSPCEPSQCCWSTLTLCRDSSGVLYYTKNPPFPTPNMCYVYPYPCTFICEEMPEPAPTPLGLDENINPQNGFSTLVYPNPGTAWFNIKFNSESEGLHTIEVYNELGNLITIYDFSKLQGEITIQLNMSDYPNGNYNYVIKYNNKPGINGSFNLIK